MGNMIKNLVCYICVLGTAGFELFVFVTVANKGVPYLGSWAEPNETILALEIAACVVFLIIALERIFSLFVFVAKGSN